MIKKAQIPTVICIAINTLLSLPVLVFCLLVSEDSEFARFMFMFAIYGLWVVILSTLNFAVAFVLTLAKKKEGAMSLVAGGVYVLGFGAVSLLLSAVF